MYFRYNSSVISGIIPVVVLQQTIPCHLEVVKDSYRKSGAPTTVMSDFNIYLYLYIDLFSQHWRNDRRGFVDIKQLKRDLKSLL